VGGKSGLIREYWLALRINHGMFEDTNVEITNVYKVITTKKIYKGEEIILDYNRDVLCSHCDVENCFFFIQLHYI
jgi:hypothetical protein